MKDIGKRIGRQVKDGIGSIPNRLDRKGRERLTIMFIPHGNDRVFTVHMNWHMIGFIAGSILLSVGLSFYGYYLHKGRAAEVQKQKDLYGINFTAAVDIEDQTTIFKKQQQKLRSNLTRIARLIGYQPDSLQQLPKPDDLRQMKERLIKNEVITRLDTGSDYLRSIYSVAGSGSVLYDDLSLVKSVDFSAKKGIGIYNQMPLGRPVSAGYRDTSDYGIRVDPITGAQMEFHSGLDMANSRGTPIHATADGEVVNAMHWDAGYGNAVVIKHAFGLQTLYGHMERLNVSQGQYVRKGAVVGFMGSTGRVTGVHVHYEVWQGNSQRTDPKPFVCAKDLASARCRSFHR